MLLGVAYFVRAVDKQAKTLADSLGADIIIIPKAAEDIAAISHRDLPGYPEGGVSVIFVRLSTAAKVSDLAIKIQKSYSGTALIRKGSFAQGAFWE